MSQSFIKKEFRTGDKPPKYPSLLQYILHLLQNSNPQTRYPTREANLHILRLYEYTFLCSYGSFVKYDSRPNNIELENWWRNGGMVKKLEGFWNSWKLGGCNG